MPTVPMIVRVALAALLTASATAAVAQPPDPFAGVPRDRAALAEPTGTDRVFGGREVPDGQYPFQVALLKSENLSSDPQSQYEAQFCGGTIIAPTWVLTAAHCMRDAGATISPDAFVVLADTTDLEAGKRVAVKSVYVNEQYDENSMDHDVALIELSDPVGLPPVALGADIDVAKATVIGWGMNESGQYPRHLLATDIDVVANTECNAGIRAIYAKALKSGVADLARQYRIKPQQSDRLADELALGIADPLTDTMVCAGLKAGGRNSCYGDSGGPLIAMAAGKPIQFGIVSWGEGPADSDVKCGHADVYGVYGRVASFKDWIDAHLRQGG